MSDTAQYMGDKMRAETFSGDAVSAQAMKGIGQLGSRQSLYSALESRVQRSEDASRDKDRLTRLLQLAGKHEEIFEMISLVRDLGLL